MLHAAPTQLNWERMVDMGDDLAVYAFGDQPMLAKIRDALGRGLLKTSGLAWSISIRRRLMTRKWPRPSNRKMDAFRMARFLMMTTWLSTPTRAALGLCLALCAAIATPADVAAQAQGRAEGWRKLYPGLEPGAYPEEWAGDAEQFIRNTLDNASASYPDPVKKIGDMFLEGGGANFRDSLTPDPARAADFYEYAAGLGALHAMPMLVQLYLTSPDVPDHCALARDWLDAYLQYGRPPPMTLERLDRTLCPDLDEAREDVARRMERLEARSERGLTFSRTWLGDVYADGGDVPRDPARAIALWTSAMEDGNGLAAGRLLKAYAEGSLVPRDCDAARDLFDRSVRGEILLDDDVRTAWLQDMSRDTPTGYCTEPDRTGRAPAPIAPPPLPNETAAETQRRLADPTTIASAQATEGQGKSAPRPAPEIAAPSEEEIALERAEAERRAKYKKIFDEGARSARTGSTEPGAPPVAGAPPSAVPTTADIGDGYKQPGFLRAMMEGAARQSSPENAVIYMEEFLSAFRATPDCAHLVDPVVFSIVEGIASQAVMSKTIGAWIAPGGNAPGDMTGAAADGFLDGLGVTGDIVSVIQNARSDAQTFYSRFGCRSDTARTLFQNIASWARGL